MSSDFAPSQQEFPVATAISSGSLELVDMLVKAGAKTDVMMYGHTLTEAANEFGYTNIVEYLTRLEHAPKISSADNL